MMTRRVRIQEVPEFAGRGGSQLRVTQLDYW
jgi:hypothetical protein